MASLNINAQAPENGGIFPFLKLPAEIRNRIYQYTFAAPLGHLEIFDLLEPIPGGALLYTCKQIRAEAKAMYDCARALVQWDYYSFVLNINRPQFDGYEGQRKISKICEAIQGLNTRQLNQVQHLMIPSPFFTPDGQLRYLYSDGVWESSPIHASPLARHSAANTHPRFAVVVSQGDSLQAGRLSHCDVVLADEMGQSWTVLTNFSARVAAEARARMFPRRLYEGGVVCGCFLVFDQEGPD